MTIKFDYEKLLIFWELRGIVVFANKPMMQIKGYDARKTKIDNGEQVVSVIYHKDGTNYYLAMLEIQEPDVSWGTLVVTHVGKEALREIEKI